MSRFQSANRDLKIGLPLPVAFADAGNSYLNPHLEPRMPIQLSMYRLNEAETGYESYTMGVRRSDLTTMTCTQQIDVSSIQHMLATNAPLMIFSDIANQAIYVVNSTQYTVTVAGDYRTTFIVGDKFSGYGYEAAYSGEYTVSAVSYDASRMETTVTTVEANNLVAGSQVGRVTIRPTYAVKSIAASTDTVVLADAAGDVRSQFPVGQYVKLTNITKDTERLAYMITACTYSAPNTTLTVAGALTDQASAAGYVTLIPMMSGASGIQVSSSNAVLPSLAAFPKSIRLPVGHCLYAINFGAYSRNAVVGTGSIVRDYRLN